jgi:hypothetical protein
MDVSTIKINAIVPKDPISTSSPAGKECDQQDKQQNGPEDPSLTFKNFGEGF